MARLRQASLGRGSPVPTVQERSLRRAGSRCVFDKARGAGGRLSTRRMEQGWATLGTPFISAKRDPFRSQLREWVRQGWLARGARRHLARARHRIVGAGAAEKPITDRLSNLRNWCANCWAMRPATLARVAALAAPHHHSGRRAGHGDYDCIVCSVPDPRRPFLLDALPLLRERLGEVRYRPIWSF